MLEPFRQLCARNGLAFVWTLPDSSTMNYIELAEYFSEEIQQLNSCHIIAESFSGPIGVLLAHRFPTIVNRLTLVASFATSPLPKLANMLPWRWIAGMPLPTWVATRVMVGDRPDLVPTLRTAVQSSSATVLAHRLRLVQNTDVLKELSELKCHLTYMRPTNDRLIPGKCMKEIVSANPDAVIKTITGPHLILETQPVKSWELIRATALD